MPDRLGSGSTRSPMPPTRAAAASAAKNGTSAPILDSSSSSLRSAATLTSRAARPRRQPAAASEEPPPSPAAIGIRFSSARQTSSGSTPTPARSPCHARFRPSSGRSAASAPSTRRPLQPGRSRRRSASSRRTSSLSSRWNPSSRRPTTRRVRLSFAGGVEAQRPHIAPSRAVVRQAHSSTPSVCGRRSPSTPQRSRAASTSSSRDRQLSRQPVVDLLASLAEPRLHDAIERLAALPDRHDRLGLRRSRSTAESTSGGGSNAAEGTRATTSRLRRSGRRPTDSSSGRARPRCAPRPRAARARRSAPPAARPRGTRAAAGW